MPRSRHRCYRCRRLKEDVGHISRSGLCEQCGIDRMRENVVAVQGRDEMGHRRWVEAWLAGCGAYGRPQTPYGVELDAGEH